MTATIIDSHIHFDCILDSGIKDIIADNSITVISWSYIRDPPGFLADYDAYFTSQKDICRAGDDEDGIPVFRCIGIHPRSIPREFFDADRVRKEDIKELLARHASEHDVVGIGEIGLETGSDVEIAIFKAQLEFAIERNIPACIHTPRNNKEEIAKMIFEILDTYQKDNNNTPILIDHITSPWLLDETLMRGFHAGLTISKSKLSPEEAIRLVTSHTDCASRIMLNSDFAGSDTEEYRMYIDTIPKLPDPVKCVAGEVAARFFGI